MLVSLSFLLLLFLTVGEFRQRSPLILLPIVLAAIVWFPLWIDEEMAQRHGQAALFEARLLFLLFLSVLCFLRLPFSFFGSSRNSSWRTISGDLDKFDTYELFYISVISLFLALFCFVLGLRVFSIQRAMSLGWWEFVQSGSALVLFGTYLSYAGSGLSLAVVKIYRYSRLRAFLGLLLLLVFILFSVFVLKTRSYVLIAVLPLIVFVSLNGGAFGRLAALALLPLATFLFVASRAVRHAGSFSDFLQSELSVVFSSAISGGEVQFVDAFVFFVANQNSFEGFGQGATIIRILFFWLPSAVFPFKPVEFSYVMHNAYYGSLPGESFSMHPTLLGDAFANHGLVGMFLYPLIIAVLAIVLDVHLKRARKVSRIFIFCLLSVTLLVFSRGAVYNSFMFTIGPILIFFFCSYFVRFLLKYRLF